MGFHDTKGLSLTCAPMQPCSSTSSANLHLKASKNSSGVSSSPLTRVHHLARGEPASIPTHLLSEGTLPTHPDHVPCSPLLLPPRTAMERQSILSPNSHRRMQKSPTSILCGQHPDVSPSHSQGGLIPTPLHSPATGSPCYSLLTTREDISRTRNPAVLGPN